MLTKVYLEGALGKKFGREWELSVNTPNEALRLINANVGGVFRWIKQNLKVYEKYRVVVKYRSGKYESLGEDTYLTTHEVESIRFVPMIDGGKGAFKVILGLTLIAVGMMGGGNPMLLKMGITMTLSGIIEALITPSGMKKKDSKKSDSFFFDGPESTQSQGNPIPLVYGRVMIGAQAISAKMTVDDIPI